MGINLQLWPRDTDAKILMVLGPLLGAAVVGTLLPEPAPLGSFGLFGAFISSALLVLAWGAFHLVRPIWWKWTSPKSSFIAIPIIWLLLVGALGVWFYHLRADWNEQRKQRIVIRQGVRIIL